MAGGEVDTCSGLGSTANRTYFTAMSNAPNDGNTNERFVNSRYGGTHLYTDDTDVKKMDVDDGHRRWT